MLDLSKPVRFRDAPHLKIVSVVENPAGSKNSRLIVNFIDPKHGLQTVFVNDDGSWRVTGEESHLDLINTESRYINVYSNGKIGSYLSSREEADTIEIPGRIAVLRIDLETKTAHLEKG